MKQRGIGYAALAVATLLSIGVTAALAGNTWVSDKGHTVQLDGENTMFFGDGATEIKMGDLADGETRVLGVGEKQLSASRRGDEVTITRAAAGENEALNVTCSIDRDSCRIITFADEPEKVMLVIEKTRRCVDGAGDCKDVDVDVMAFGEHKTGMQGDHDVIHRAHGEAGEGVHVIRIRKSVECDEAGNCRDIEEVSGDGDGGEAEVIIQSLGGGTHVAGKHGEMVFIRGGDQVTLRCSEGDTTMQVEKKEADEVFLCPKHSTPLEQVTSHPRVMRHKTKRESH